MMCGAHANIHGNNARHSKILRCAILAMMPKRLRFRMERKSPMDANLKVVHLVCACLFVGNVIVSGVWAFLAERTRQHAIIQFSNRMVLITDVLFTLLGSLGVVWTGHTMAEHWGDSANPAWIQWSYYLLMLSGLIWLLVLVPIQLKQRALLRDTDIVCEAYWRLSRLWQIAGAMATVLTFPIVYFMVTKTG